LLFCFFAFLLFLLFFFFAFFCFFAFLLFCLFALLLFMACLLLCFFLSQALDLAFYSVPPKHKHYNKMYTVLGSETLLITLKFGNQDLTSNSVANIVVEIVA
jgi:hypothetical protein